MLITTDKGFFLTASQPNSRCKSLLWPQHGTLQIEMRPLSWQFCSLLWHFESVLEYHVRPSPSHCNPFLVFRFNDESHAWQTNHTCLSVKGQCYNRAQQGLRGAPFENQNMTLPNWIPLPLYSEFFFFFFFKEPHWVVGPPSQHWDWHQRSHLITLWGIWEVSAIKWSGAIK